MKKISLLILFALHCSIGFAQEKYFHELRGLEDSTGTTHLFYRMYEKSTGTYTCNGQDEYTSYSYHDDINHFNTSTLKDSVIFEDFFLDGGCTGWNYTKDVSNFEFYESDPNKWVTSGRDDCAGLYINDYLDRSSFISVGCITKTVPNWSSDLTRDFPLLLGASGDTLYQAFFDRTFKFEITDNFHPTVVEGEFFDEELLDSMVLPYNIRSIHPAVDSIFYALGANSELLMSTRFGSTFFLADTLGATSFLAFDADSTIIYSINTLKVGDEYIRRLKRSDNFGHAESWSILNLADTFSSLKFINTDSETPGHLFVSNSSNIYESTNFGETFVPLFETDDEIKGVYHKPNSAIVYILTDRELIQLENQTSIILNTIPVSNELDPETPNQLVLHQNYPNPFNPSTVISYQLPVSGRVRLAVFDALGREIAVLVDANLSSGTHSATFQSNDISSGIYFYQLIVYNTGEIFSKRMTLIK